MLSQLFSVGFLATLVASEAAIVDSPSYAPQRVDCPAGISIRRTSTSVPLNPSEAAYVIKKTQNSQADWTAYLNNVNLQGLNVASFVQGTVKGRPGVDMPNVAFAISGGGERAMLVGGSILAAMDNRNASAVASKVGGIQQIATYIAGLSGGSWITGSWALAGFPTLEELRDEVWHLVDDFSAPRKEEPGLFTDTVNSLAVKAAAGFNVTFNDLFGRQLSYHLINETGPATGIGAGPGSRTLYHSIRDTPRFKAAVVPFPVIIAINRVAGEANVTIKSPVMEFTPYEFGTWDPTVSPAPFVPIEYLGSEFKNGLPLSNGSLNCVIGYDNAGFVMATSGEFFGAPAQLVPFPAEKGPILMALGPVPDNLVVDSRIPSPFISLNPTTFKSSAQGTLDLVDGGLAGENVPLTPMLQKERMVDVIIAIDASADTGGNYPNGTEPHATYLKSLLPGFAGNFPMPYFPDADAFVAAGLNQKPGFFGSVCTGQSEKTPLIVYLPNYNVLFNTGTSTFTASYSVQDQISFFNNGQAIASQSNSSAWATCLACAIVDSQLTRNGVARSTECNSCFTKYCFTSAGP